MKISTVMLSGLAALVMGCTTESVNPVPTPTYCAKDTDCKGERICDKGVCVDSGLDSKDVSGNSQLYVWGVGNCEVGYKKEDFLSAIKSQKYELVKSFSKNDIDLTADPNNVSCYNSYICALSKEPNLYVLKTNKGVSLIDNFFLVTNQEFPGIQNCRNIEWNKLWYKDCFILGSDCPGP